MVSRDLPADESRPQPQGISDAEHQPARAERSIERVQVAEIIEHVVVRPRESTIESRSAATPGRSEMERLGRHETIHR